MSIKKKILVVALALGSVLGFAHGFKSTCGSCHRGSWEQARSGPCERFQRHHGRRGSENHGGKSGSSPAAASIE